MKNNKIISVLPLCTILLCSFVVDNFEGGSGTPSGGVSSKKFNYKDDVDLMVIPPSLINYNSPISFRVSFQNYTPKSVSLYHINPLNNEREVLFSERIMNSLEKEISYSEIYSKYQYSKSIDKAPTFIVEGLNLSDSCLLFSRTFKAEYYNNASASNLNGSSVYESTAKILYHTYKDGTKYLSEKFTFKESDNDYYYLELDADNCLKFNYPMFKYTPIDSNYSYPNPIDNVEGMYIDVANLFPNISENKLVYYYGNLYKDENSYFCFEPSTRFYIDPLTKVLYKQYDDGRMLTKNFYFPKESKSKVESIDNFENLFYISCHFGLSKTYLTFAYRLVLSDSNLIGSCADSEYCIEEKDVEPDFTMGTSKEG